VNQARVVDLQAGVLLVEERVRVQESRMLVLQRGAADAFGGHVLFVAFQAAIGVGQTVLEDALEAGFGVALLPAAAIGVFEAAISAAGAVLEQETGEGQGSGDDGSAAE
jgi:chorismate synthase